MNPETAEPRITIASVSAQGAMLFAGYGLSQGMSFARNALLGHLLSPRDFGIAASITLLLQLVETISDLGSDRLIVQADDGDTPAFVATAHTVLALRGVILALILIAAGPLAAEFFDAGQASDMFLWAACIPLIKGFTHLDCRRAQRTFDNRPQILVEVIPQAVALFATLPVVRMAPDYSAVVVLAMIQAGASVAVARLVATSGYSLAADRDVIWRLVKFGWPIVASALPLIAVYQGDRAIIGRLFGVEALAAYSAAFMITMVPGLLAARAGHSLMLPMFADMLRRGLPLRSRFAQMSEATVLLAALLLGLFVIGGEKLLTLAFGAHYAGYGGVVAWLAAMWALRMVQAVPGMALMAAGETKPFLFAGIIRASVLPLVLAAALKGADLSVLAATGCAGEIMSLLYIAARLERIEFGLGGLLAMRALFLIPAGVLALLVRAGAELSILQLAGLALAALATIAAAGLVLMPHLRAQTRLMIKSAASSPTTQSM